MAPNFFDRNPLIYKISILVYALFTLIVVFADSYFAGSRVTDENVFAGNTPKIVVTVVNEGGASDRAGMLVGDTIYSINGKTFLNAQDADRILRASEPGSIMDYGIIRGNQKLILKVQAARLGINANTVIGSITFLLFLAVGLYIGLVRSNEKGARILSWALVLLAPLVTVITGGRGVNGLPLLIVVSGSFFIGFPLNTYAELFIPEKDSKFSKARKVVLSSLGLSLISFVLTWSWIIFNFPSLAVAKSGILSIPLTIPFVIILYMISNIVVTKYLREKPSKKYLAPVGNSWAVFGMSTAVFLTAGNFFNPIYFYGLILTAAPPVAWFYLMTTHRLFGINIPIKRSIQYTVFNVFFWVFLVIFYFWFLNLISNITLGDIGFRFTPTALEIGDKDAKGFTDRPLFILLGIVSFVLIVQIKKRGQKILKQLFFKEDYDYKNAVSEVSELIATNITVDTLLAALSSELKSILKLKGVAVYINESGKSVLKSFNSLDEDKLKEIDGSELFQNLNKLKHPTGIEKTSLENLFKKAELQFIVPLIIKDKMIGAILLGEKLSETAYKQADITFVESLSRQIAVAIENSRLSDDARKSDLIKRDLELAKKIQMNLLPSKTPSIGGLQITGSYIPANEVGGDYYDFLTPILNLNSEPNKVTVVVGDVAGKGISASLYMSRVQGIIRSLYHTGNFSPKALLSHANELIYSVADRKSFVTMVCAEFEMKEKVMTFSRAGHLPILHYSAADKKCNQLTSVGFALGMRVASSFNDVLGEEKVKFGMGDIFVLYSDGISEAMNMAKGEYGFDRLEEILISNCENNSEKILKAIETDLISFVGEAEPSDDITLVVVKISN